jgi:tRNA(Ser,Leu) C12 N-acetylase TAN1
MKQDLKLLEEWLEASQKELISEAICYESFILLEAISQEDLETMSKAIMALAKASAPYAQKLPLLRSLTVQINSLFIEIESEDDEVRAAQLTAHATAIMTQLDDALDYVNNKLMDIFEEKLPVSSNPTTPLNSLMSAKQAASVADKISKQLFRSDLFSKLPFLKGNLAREGFTQSQAKSLGMSLLNLSFQELKNFINHAAQAAHMIDSIKNKVQDLESISTSKLGAAWGFVKNIGTGVRGGGSMGGLRG